MGLRNLYTSPPFLILTLPTDLLNFLNNFIQEQRLKLPQIILSKHDKPQTIALMTQRNIMEFGDVISGKNDKKSQSENSSKL